MGGKLRGAPVCESILIWRGLSPETSASPHLNRPVCERILTQQGSASPDSSDSVPSTTQFVSESSHIGTRTIPNRRRGVVVSPRLRANLANSPLVDSLPLIRISH